MSERSRRKRGGVYTRNYYGQKDNEYWISSVLRCLIRNENRMVLEKLQKKVEDEHKKKFPDFEINIKRYSNLFRLEESDLSKEDEEDEGVLKDIIVSGRTEVRLCEKHCSQAGSCRSLECKSLHMCRFYILNECHFNPCLFGHEIRTDHNVRILRMHLLHALGPQDVGYLLRDVRNRNETTMPTLCSFYNIKKGCSREDCQFLHLCKKFVEEDCKFGSGCKRSHNCFDKQPAEVFKRYGILSNDVKNVMELIRKTLDKNTPANAATGVIQTCYNTPKSVKYSSNQVPYNRYFVNKKESALDENEALMRSSTSCIDAPGQITKEVIYTRSRPQSDNSYQIGDDLGPDTYNGEDSRHVVIDEGNQNKPKHCYGDLVHLARKSQENETHQTHMKEGAHFEDISSDEDDEPPDNVDTTFMMQERACLETSKICSPKETQKNEPDIKGESMRLVQTIDNQKTRKPSCSKSPTVSTEAIEFKYETKELEYETLDCPGIKTKLQSYSLSFFENKKNEIQIKSMSKKRAFQPTTDKTEEEQIVSAEILNNIIDLIDTEEKLAAKGEVKNEISKEDTANKGSESTFQELADVRVFQMTECNDIEHVPATDREYNQAVLDNSSENIKKADATSLVLKNHIHNSEGSKTKDSQDGYAFNSSQEIQYTLAEDSMYEPKCVSYDRLENVNETCSSTLTKGDKECDWSLGTQEFNVKRAMVNNGKPQWMFCSVDTWTSLNIDSETQEKLEKSYQLFQQSRQCFIEASGSMLHVDFMTMCGKILNNHVDQQGK